MTDKACGRKERRLKGKQWKILISISFFSVFLWCFTAYLSGYYVQSIGMLLVIQFVGFPMMLHNFIIRSIAERGETKALFLILNYFLFWF